MCPEPETPMSVASGNPSLAWLAQITANAKETSTPLGAFLAMLPKPVVRKPKSSRERGKAFHERQRLREEQLEHTVEALRDEIVSLETKQRLWETRWLHTRSSASSSLCQVVVELHRLFRHGLLELPAAERPGQKRLLIDDAIVNTVQHQEAFMRSVYDPEAVLGHAVGPEAGIIQWRRYTQAHASITGEVLSLQVTHVDDGIGTVTLVAQCCLRVRISIDTFHALFPFAMHDANLVTKLVGKEVTYPTIKRYEFSPDGRIVSETVDADFVRGLMDAGCSLKEVVTLMARMAIQSDAMIEEVLDVDEESDVQLMPSAGPDERHVSV